MWSFGIKVYQEVFNKTKESSACGPSGIHMSHWKAACTREKTAQVHSFFYVGHLQIRLHIKTLGIIMTLYDQETTTTILTKIEDSAIV